MFEQFMGKKQKHCDFPIVTISKYGHFGFNKYIAKNYIKDNKYVTLWFDKGKSSIAFKFSNKQDMQTYSIRGHGKKRQSPAVLCIAFFKYYDIFPKETKSYIAKWHDFEKDKMLVICVA